jgi:hypothetical protein
MLDFFLILGTGLAVYTTCNAMRAIIIILLKKKRGHKSAYKEIG